MVLPPAAQNKPRSREEKYQLKNTRSETAVLSAAFASLYAVGVVVLAPISYQIVQVRIADALLPLSILFGWPAVLGLTFGAFVANLFGGLGPLDVLGGSLANFIATYFAWRIARNRARDWIVIAIGLEIIIVTLVVGTYLSYILAIPLQVGYVGVLLGSIIAIGLLGSMILYALSAERIASILRSHGILIYTWTENAEAVRSRI